MHSYLLLVQILQDTSDILRGPTRHSRDDNFLGRFSAGLDDV